MGYIPLGCNEADTAEHTDTHTSPGPRVPGINRIKRTWSLLPKNSRSNWAAPTDEDALKSVNGHVKMDTEHCELETRLRRFVSSLHRDHVNFLCIIPTGWKVPVLRYCLQKTVGKDYLGTKLEVEGKSGMEKGMCSLCSTVTMVPWMLLCPNLSNCIL